MKIQFYCLTHRQQGSFAPGTQVRGKPSEETKNHKENISNTYNENFIFSGMLCYAVSCYVIAPTIPLILDVVLPKNETRIRSLSFDLDYGIDMQEYWFWLWLHSSMAAIIVVFNIIAGDVMFITLNMHTCYLFAMAR